MIYSSMFAVAALLATTSQVNALRPPSHCIWPASNNSCPLEHAIVDAIAPATENGGICFTTFGKGEKRLTLEFENVLAEEHKSLKKLFIAPNGKKCSVTDFWVPGGSKVTFKVKIPEANEDCKVKIGLYGSDSKYNSASPVSGITAKKCRFSKSDKCRMCAYDNLEVSLPPTVCLRPMTVVAASLKVDHLRKKKLDKILKKKVAQELCAGEGPPFIPNVDSTDACTDLNKHWVTLKTEFYTRSRGGSTLPGVDAHTSTDELIEWAHAQTKPHNTKAVGIFVGACGLEHDPHRPLAVVTTYCGPAPVPQPVPVARSAAVVASADASSPNDVLAAALGL